MEMKIEHGHRGLKGSYDLSSTFWVSVGFIMRIYCIPYSKKIKCLQNVRSVYAITVFPVSVLPPVPMIGPPLFP